MSLNVEFVSMERLVQALMVYSPSNKTRSFNTTSPLQYLEKHQYIQCQIQMHCSGRDNIIQKATVPIIFLFHSTQSLFMWHLLVYSQLVQVHLNL